LQWEKLKYYYSRYSINRRSFDQITKVGGLDSRDQSRSRSRTSFVSRLTFENRRDYPSCQDFSVEIFKIETFQLRLGCVEIFIEIVETNWDYRDKSRWPSRLNWDFSISIKKSRLSRPTLFWRLDRDHVETNRDPQGY
jgi:hypothetical protein